MSTCTGYQTLIPIFHDFSNGESELNGSYSLTCPRCNHSESIRRSIIIITIKESAKSGIEIFKFSFDVLKL